MMSPAGRPLEFPLKKVLGFDADLVGAVDEWRRQQDDLPSFSDAVRELVRLGLARAKASKSRRESRDFR
jgi:hypothetical protein